MAKNFNLFFNIVFISFTSSHDGKKSNEVKNKLEYKILNNWANLS
jgi:hypothetical protein